MHLLLLRVYRIAFAKVILSRALHLFILLLPFPNLCLDNTSILENKVPEWIDYCILLLLIIERSIMKAVPLLDWLIDIVS